MINQNPITSLSELRTALKKLVDYNWNDERHDYIVHEKERGHIFETIHALDEWLKG